jgi:hypothetical protein
VLFESADEIFERLLILGFSSEDESFVIPGSCIVRIEFQRAFKAPKSVF